MGTPIVPISVHLCIGDPALVHAIRDLLMDDVDLTGTSARPAAAVVALRDADADMLLVDVDLIADVQRELTSLLARDGDDSERGVILVGATSVHLDVMRAALTAGARGVLPAVLTEADLRAALHTVHRGHVWLSRMSVAALVDQPSTDVRVNMDAFATRHGLTAREGEVLRLVVTGASNAAIATELCLAERTVKHHQSGVLRKTGAHDRAHLVAIALSPTTGPRADRTAAPVASSPPGAT